MFADSVGARCQKIPVVHGVGTRVTVENSGDAVLRLDTEFAVSCQKKVDN